MRITNNAVAATLALIGASLAACGGGGGSSAGGATGTLRLALTDAPSCGYDAVNVVVEKVRVHQSGNAGDNDAGWSEVALTPPRRIDLLSLSNGVLEELGQTQLPAGTYTQMRLALADANTVVPSGGAETALQTPSAQQSGLKLDTHISVEPGKVADFVLDFDACKSVVRAGSSGRYNLKPVIAVIPRLSDAGQRIVGYVDAPLALGSTRISAQSNGVEVKSTPPISSGSEAGKFVLYPVPVGDYTLVVSADGRATAVLTNVPVTASAITYANPASAPIAPPASSMRAAAGAIAINGSGADTQGQVAATQALDSSLTVEVASQRVDAASGAYAFALPASAPQRAAYAASGVPSFAPVASAAGKYMLIATIPSVAPKTASIDLSSGSITQSFAFP